eukprot:COSAG06_NODE_3918_length_4769_cov_2.014133_4_plen_116_part_00
MPCEEPRNELKDPSKSLLAHTSQCRRPPRQPPLHTSEGLQLLPASCKAVRLQFQGGPERLSKIATVPADMFALCVCVSPFLFLLLRFPHARDLFEGRRGWGRVVRARDVTYLKVL